jgi:hypothetical protein
MPLNSYTTFWNNALYRGTLVYGDLTIENYCEPVVDQATWDIVQKISKTNTKHGHMKGLLNHPRRVHSNYLLSGLAKCGRCGAPLYGQVSPQRYGDAIESYRCNRGRRRRDCDLPRIPGYAFEQGILTNNGFTTKFISITKPHKAGKRIREYHKSDKKTKEINLFAEDYDLVALLEWHALACYADSHWPETKLTFKQFEEENKQSNYYDYST